jgi:hypothetical protein
LQWMTTAFRLTLMAPKDYKTYPWPQYFLGTLGKIKYISMAHRSSVASKSFFI